MILNDDYKFIFVHIPKNAGTSIRTALSSLAGTEPFLVSATTKHETYREFEAHWPERSGRPPSDLEAFRVIAVVRNPWDRFLSLHRYLRETHKARYPEVARTANDFARQIALRPSWAEGIRSLRPQVRFLEGAPGEPEICRFETLQNDLGTALARCGATLPPLERLNSSGASSGMLTRIFGTRKKEKPRYQDVLDPEAAGIIGSMFAEDVASFGFRF